MDSLDLINVVSLVVVALVLAIVLFNFFAGSDAAYRDEFLVRRHGSTVLEDKAARK